MEVIIFLLLALFSLYSAIIYRYIDDRKYQKAKDSLAVVASVCWLAAFGGAVIIFYELVKIFCRLI